jgi:hypothetical protein
MLAAALILVHAAPPPACASGGAPAACCGDCDTNTCILAPHVSCLDSEPTSSKTVDRVHAPSADVLTTFYSPDSGDLIAVFRVLGLADATAYLLSLVPKIGSAPRLYLLLRQLRL